MAGEEVASLVPLSHSHCSSLVLYFCVCVSLILMEKWPSCSSLAMTVYLSAFLWGSQVVMENWPRCSSLVRSFFVCKSSSEEEMATLFLLRYLFKMATLLLSSYASLSVCVSMSKSSSDGEVVTLLFSSSICFVCISATVMKRWPPCSSLVRSVFYLSLCICLFVWVE